MALRAAFFDVGDTLVEHWAGAEVLNAKARAQVVAELGERPWLGDLVGAWIEPPWPTPLAHAIAAHVDETVRFAPDAARQETVEWYRAWFTKQGIELDGLDLDRLRSLLSLSLPEISTPVPGAFDAIRWCQDHALKVALVTNTLARGDKEALTDWQAFGLDEAIDVIVTSHDARWRKPHPAIFERALDAVSARPEEAFHVGDNLIADVWGAKQLGLRAIWRRSHRARALGDGGEMAEDPAITGERKDPAICDHPPETLFLRGGEVMCGACGADTGIDLRPDAVIDDLTELPAIVERWS